jgi:hypothetical protein
MKTSSRIVIAGLLVTLVTLMSYDVLIKKTYFKGLYKIPYQGFANLDYKNFDQVDLLSSTAVNAKFIQGPFSVRIDPDAREYTRIRQQGSRLIIEANFKGSYLGNPNAYTLIISCPQLAAVTAGATYLTNNRAFTDTTVRADWKMRQVMIESFQQDSIHIQQDYGSTLILENNHIKSVNAEIGKSARSASHILVGNGNVFDNFFLSAGGSSKFYLANSVLKNIIYQQGDSAVLELTGAARHLLSNLKNQLK